MNRNLSASNSKTRAALTLLFKSALAIVLLFWLVRSGRLDFAAFADLKPSLALAGTFFFEAAMLACLMARWHFMANALGLKLKKEGSARISLIGFFAAIWTPASLGLDGARLLSLRRLRPNQNGAAVASVLWDRILGVWTLLTLCAASGLVLWRYPMSPALRHLVLILCGASLLAVALGVFVRFSPALLRLSPAGWREALENHRSAPIAKPLIIFFATPVCNAMATWCALRALGFDAPIGSTLVAMPLIILSSLAPLTPLGLGVTDAAAATLLNAVGVAGGAEATMLARSSFVLICAACGLAWFWPARE